LKGNSYLADLRKRAGLTQHQLSQKLGLPRSYGQKKISLWESDLSRPDSAEIEKLSKVLSVSQEQLTGYFANPNAQSIVDLFSRLAVSEHPALLAACYSGRPRILSDPLVRSKCEAALKHNLFIAMFVPFPLLPIDGHSASNLLLSAYCTRVWGSVFASCERLRETADGKNIDKHLAVYGPSRTPKSDAIVIPPFVSRYSLLIEKDETGTFNKSLHIAVETATSKYLQLIGTDKDEAASEQIEDWEAYFGGVTNTWMKHATFPRADCGYWRHIGEALLAKGN
jgi:transcriptional regulator with XRE-family HTH domain